MVLADGMMSGIAGLIFYYHAKSLLLLLRVLMIFQDHYIYKHMGKHGKPDEKIFYIAFLVNSI